MSARALIVYAVDVEGGEVEYFPTKGAALREAREHAGAGFDVEIRRITIPGPFNRELACRLLKTGGYASEIETVWLSPR